MKKKRIFIENNKKMLDRKLQAIIKALGIHKNKKNCKNTSITVFCDLHKAFRATGLVFICLDNKF